MNKTDTLHNLLFGLAALAMVAALAFLYDKTQAVDLRGQNETQALLRELKEIDNRWDVDVLQSRLETGAATIPLTNRTAAANKALENLAASLQYTASPAVSAGLPDLRTAILQKADAVEKFKAANAGAKAGLDGLLRNGAELNAQIAEIKPRAATLEATLARLASFAPQYYSLGQDVQRAAIEFALTELQSSGATLPEAARIKAEQTRNAGLNLLAQKPVELELAGKLAYLTSGPRLDALTFAFNRELEATLQEKERFRVYLIAYAGALLIVLGYLGGKLKAANVELEHRVQERTRELSEALKHLKESEAQLIQSEKMSSLGQMVAGVAHEINTPLAYVKNSLGTVADKLPDLGNAIANCEKLLALLQAGGNANPDDLARQFAQVSAQIAQLKQQRVVEELGGLVKDGLYGTGQMAEIVGNLKDFSRLDRSKVTSFNLNEGINSTLLLAKHLLKSVTIQKQYGEIPSVICSPSQVNQVFLNLITNAAQAMGEQQGTITIVTRGDGSGVAVEISDNGKGIPPDVLPKIFDPFFSTKEIGKGTGLGLSISYKIVQQHGGRIEVESQPGAGTKFTVWLPLRPPAEAELSA
jgi:two-component system, NtrC family, sensor kinase